MLDISDMIDISIISCGKLTESYGYTTYPCSGYVGYPGYDGYVGYPGYDENIQYPGYVVYPGYDRYVGYPRYDGYVGYPGYYGKCWISWL